MTSAPKVLLHIEGIATLLTASIVYHTAGYSWTWFAILFLLPDISMIGYAFNRNLGSTIYNLGHTHSSVGLLAAIGYFLATPTLYAAALIWLAHIGFDRALGYGLKYPNSFKDTHLSRL